jgi:hypothetical protein
VLAARRLRRGGLLSVGELASLAHLPTDTAVPGLVRAAARTVAPVPWLRTVGKVLGDTDAGPSKVWQAATHRARVGETARRDTCAYADEAHNFLNLPIRFDEALAEARKYRLSLCLAHQYLGQLPRELREAISANARNKLVFAVSPEDAHALERHVAPGAVRPRPGQPRRLAGRRPPGRQRC